MEKNNFIAERSICAFFFLSIFTNLSFSAEPKLSKPLEKLNPIVTIGPEEAQLSSQLMISAEKVVVRGKIVTNGFGITIVTRILEFENGSEIVSFDKARPSNDNVLRAAPAPDTAGNGSQGRDGRIGWQGMQGHDGHGSPGAITIYAAIIIGAPKINGSGQQGGTGGSGQPGQPGAKGGRGSPAESGPLGLWWEAGPGMGAPGGSGGTGGAGGIGGKGGVPTRIEVHYGKYFQRKDDGSFQELTLNSSSELVSKGGEGGPGGAPGPNGPGGPGGEGGYASRTVWRSSGGGAMGATGSVSAQTSLSGATGEPDSTQGPVVKQGTYAEITDETGHLGMMIDTINASRELDNLVRDFKLIFTDQKASDSETQRLKLGFIRSRLIPLTNRIQPSASHEQVLKYQKQNLHLLGELSSELENASRGQPPTAKVLEELDNTSEQLIKRIHSDGIESMKAICKKILALKDGFLSEETAQAVAVNAYRIFGPKELEEWVFKNDVAGSRDQLIPHHDIETSILGSKNSYPIHIGNQPYVGREGESIVLP